MADYEMPKHIINHSEKVKDVGVFLSKELNKKGLSLDIKLIEAAAMLHDIYKIQCIGTEKRHDKEGANILRQLGYHRIAEIVEQLRGTAGKRQVKGVKQGITLNLGGTGSTAVMHILSRE